MTRDDDKTYGEPIMRGCMWGLLFAIPIWALIYWLLWLFFG